EEHETQVWVSHLVDENPSFEWKTSTNSQAALHVRWKTEEEQGPARSHEWRRTSLNPQRFVDELKNEHLLFDVVKPSVGKASACPSSQCELPIYCSSCAPSKIDLPFVRCFEADLFLKEESFLNHMQFPARWTFEIAETDANGGDAEGTARQPLTFL